MLLQRYHRVSHVKGLITRDRWQWLPITFPLFDSSAPSSPPLNFRGYNLSSTSIKVTWGDVPKSSVNGILLGYHVTCILSNSSEVPKIESLKKHSGVLSGLKKYRNYTCSVRAYNNFGNGTWSEKLVISSDEDGMLSVKKEGILAARNETK